MLIGICGGICAGKNSVQEYLISQHGFRPLKLQRTSSTPTIEKSASEATLPENNSTTTKIFANVAELLDFATKDWQTNYVTTSVHDETVVEALSHRPFFVLIHIDAPISIRWQRFKDRCAKASLTPPTLEQFVVRNDVHLYDPTTGLAALASRAQIKLLNSTTSLQKLWGALDSLKLPDPSRMRPTWDHYFMKLASLAARRSNCMRRQVGCVLVREKRVMATGYNGTPRNVANCNEGGCPRCNGGGGGGAALSTCLCIHAEENALLEAGRERVGGGAVLYCNTCPCLTCSIKIVQVGITEVVFSQSYYMDQEAAKIFGEAGVKLRQFSPPKEGLVNLTDSMISNGSHARTGPEQALAYPETEAAPARSAVDHSAGNAAGLSGSAPAALLVNGDTPYRASADVSSAGHTATNRPVTDGTSQRAILNQITDDQYRHTSAVRYTHGLPWAHVATHEHPAPRDVAPGLHMPMPGETMRGNTISSGPGAASPAVARSNALTANNLAANSVVGKRPAETEQSRPAKRSHLGTDQAKSRALNLSDPLASVSKTAKSVYEAVAAILKENKYLEKVYDEDIVQHLLLPQQKVEPAIAELERIGLLVETRFAWVSVPLNLWQARQEDAK